MCLACIYTHSVLLLPLLLLLSTGVLAAAAVAVRRHVPDGQTCCWLIESDSIQGFLFLHSNTIYFSCIYPLTVLSHLRPPFAYTTSSVVTGMRGAKAAISGVPLFHVLFFFRVVSFHNRVPLL